MKQICRCNIAHFHDLLEGGGTITSSTTGVYYNNDNYHEYYDTMPSLLVFEIQEFIRPPSNSISIFGADYKSKSVCGLDVAISTTGFQSVHSIAAEGQDPSALDRDFNTEHLMTSVTHRMNMTSDSGYSLYSGG